MSYRIKTFTALTSASIVIFSMMAQEEERVPCPVARMARTHTIDTLENRLSHLKTELELTDKQIRKLEVAAKRMINKQPELKMKGDNWTDHTFYRGNPRLSDFWRSVESKTLTDEQQARLSEIENDLSKRIAATAIDDFADLDSPEAMTQFHLARWTKSFQLSQEQIAKLEPVLNEQLKLGVDDTRYPLELLPKLEELEILSKSQLRPLKQLFEFRNVEFLEMEWTEFSCSDCHTN